MFQDERDPVFFGPSFVRSDAFRSLFREGMLLVEDTAAYLDGAGREEAKNLDRHAALTYASESMRLTTRLMQIASWLLIQRAVAEGEIGPGQALRDKNRVRIGPQDAMTSFSAVAVLPERLLGLIDLSIRLHARILHLDGLIADDRPAPEPRESPVAAQQGLLRLAFGGSR
jgi:regulator of CtrA degradation